jgi:tRNA(fMet)-specific endonuclease VapC
MFRYMLDTDISSYIMNRTSVRAIHRLQATAVGDVCISAVTRAELEYGVVISPKHDKDERALGIFLGHIEVLDFPSGAAVDSAQIRGFLKARGTMIGGNDLLIAAHARSLGLTLVTNNTEEFERVHGLKTENWA